jgi:hypothetical protein
MWTTILASYAAVVSTSALIVSYISYRSGGPQLSGRAGIQGRYDIQGPSLGVAVYNRGRGPITIDSLDLWGLCSAKSSHTVNGVGLPVGLPVVGWPLHSPNGGLPSRIEGNSGETWSFPAVNITKEWLVREDLSELSLTIWLANGKQLTLKVDTSDVDVLRGQELPDWQPDIFAHPKLSGREDKREDGL